MKEQYLKEMQRIHVPASLMEQTKQAMKEEEQRLKSMESKKQVIRFGKVSMAAAAAVILLLIVPAFSGERFGTAEGSIRKEQMYLAGKEEVEIVRIEAEETETGIGVWLKELLEKIGEMFE